MFYSGCLRDGNGTERRSVFGVPIGLELDLVD